MKISNIWATGLICLIAGGGIGFLLATFLGYGGSRRTGAFSAPGSNDEIGAMTLIPGGPPGGTTGGAGGGPPGGKKGGPAGKGGFRGPSAKSQLASLVAKLDQLTGNTLTVNLGDEQKKAIEEQVRGLAAMEALAEEDAQKRLDALLVTLADCKDTLVAAGYRWPGERGSRPPDTPNPFADESNAKALQALQQRLSAEPSK